VTQPPGKAIVARAVVVLATRHSVVHDSLVPAPDAGPALRRDSDRRLSPGVVPAASLKQGRTAANAPRPEIRQDQAGTVAIRRVQLWRGATSCAGSNSGSNMRETERNSEHLRAPYMHAEDPQRYGNSAAGGRAVAGSNPVSPIEESPAKTRALGSTVVSVRFARGVQFLWELSWREWLEACWLALRWVLRCLGRGLTGPLSARDAGTRRATTACPSQQRRGTRLPARGDCSAPQAVTCELGGHGFVLGAGGDWRV
jgi:hypothetical protein